MRAHSRMEEKPLARLSGPQDYKAGGLPRRKRHRLALPQPQKHGHFLQGLRHRSVSHRRRTLLKRDGVGKIIRCGLLITSIASLPWAKRTTQKPFPVNPLTSNSLCNSKCQEHIISLADFHKENLSFTGTQASGLIHKLELALFHRWQNWSPKVFPHLQAHPLPEWSLKDINLIRSLALIKTKQNKSMNKWNFVCNLYSRLYHYYFFTHEIV